MEENKIKSMDVLKIAISIVTITTPLIYLVGLNFYSGIYSGYGVSSSLFSSSIEDNLTGAYYFIAIAMTDLSLQWEVILIIGRTLIIVAIAAFGLLFFELLLKKGYVLIKYKLKPKSYDKKAEFNKLREDKYIDYKVINLTLLIYLMFVLPATAAVIGKKFTIKSIEDFKVNGCIPRKSKEGWNRCITVLDNSQNIVVAKGILVAVSDSKIAIYSENKSRVINYLDEYEIVYFYEVNENLKN